MRVVRSPHYSHCPGSEAASTMAGKSVDLPGWEAEGTSALPTGAAKLLLREAGQRPWPAENRISLGFAREIASTPLRGVRAACGIAHPKVAPGGSRVRRRILRIRGCACLISKHKGPWGPQIEPIKLTHP